MSLNDLDILAIDIRIKYCIIDNPIFEGDEYYVKIYFNYKFHNSKILKYDGKKEFTSISKDELISDIKNFMNEKKEDYVIY